MKRLYILFSSVCTVLFFLGTSHAQTYNISPSIGIHRQGNLLANTLKQRLQELEKNTPATSITVNTTYTITCSVTTHHTSLLAHFNILNGDNDSLLLQHKILYHDISDIDSVVTNFIFALQTMVTNNTKVISSPPPFVTLSNHATATSHYLATETSWLEQGASLSAWRTYYRSQKTMSAWVHEHHYNEYTATLLGLLPCSSGYLYTQNIKMGLFWSMSELTLLLYGLTRADPFQRGALLAALIPLTALDGIFSRLSARKTNTTTKNIEYLYPQKKYPFAFMHPNNP